MSSRLHFSNSLDALAEQLVENLDGTGDPFDAPVIATPTPALRGWLQIQLAEKLGNLKVANMIMLGAFVRVSSIVSFPRLLKNLPSILGAKRERFLKINQEALEQGYAFVKEQ